MGELPPQEVAITKLVELIEGEAKAEGISLGWEKALLHEWIVWERDRERPEGVPEEFHRNVKKWVKRVVEAKTDGSAHGQLITWVDEIGDAFDFNGVYSVQVLERELENYSFWQEKRKRSWQLEVGCLVIIVLLVVSIVWVIWLR
jgi:hypothetical protein